MFRNVWIVLSWLKIKFSCLLCWRSFGLDTLFGKEYIFCVTLWNSTRALLRIMALFLKHSKFTLILHEKVHLWSSRHIWEGNIRNRVYKCAVMWVKLRLLLMKSSVVARTLEELFCCCYSPHSDQAASPICCPRHILKTQEPSRRSSTHFRTWYSIRNHRLPTTSLPEEVRAPWAP